MELIAASVDAATLLAASESASHHRWQLSIVGESGKAKECLSAGSESVLLAMCDSMGAEDVAAVLYHAQIVARERPSIVLLITTPEGLSRGRRMLGSVDHALILKPFSSEEFDVRCKMAEERLAERQRVVEREQVSRKRFLTSINELECVLRRHDLLGSVLRNVAERNSEAREAEGLWATGVPDEQDTTNASDEKTAAAASGAGDDDYISSQRALSEAVANLGLGWPKIEKALGAEQSQAFDAWCSLIVVEKQEWLDLKVSFSKVACTDLFRLMVGADPESNEDLSDLSAEFINIVQSYIKKEMEDLGKLVFLPYVATSLPAGGSSIGMEKADRVCNWSFQVGGVGGTFCVAYTQSPMIITNPNTIRIGDVVGRSVMSGEGGVLINAGKPISIEQITRLQSVAADVVDISAFRPTAAACRAVRAGKTGVS